MARFYLTVTPSNTPTNTPTNTPSDTPCPTVTRTPTNTPTNTRTPTLTPTNTPTPSITPYPLCPAEIEIQQISGTAVTISGTYNRLTSYSGGSFTSAYIVQLGFSSYPMSFGTAPDGNNYATYGLVSGSTYCQYVALISSGGTFIGWAGINSTSNYVFDGGSVSLLGPVAGSGAFSTTLFDGSIYYPGTGLATFVSQSRYISYPPVCPTPTPTTTPTQTSTPTNTQTPTVTPTQTPTSSETPTPTITPTNTQTPTVTPTNTETPTPTNTQTPTITPTTTRTPTPSPVVETYLVYTGSTACVACLSSTSLTLYGPTGQLPVLNIGEYVYVDSALTIPVPNDTYIVQLSDTLRWTRVWNGLPGEITQSDPNGCLACITPTPTPTPTSTPLPGGTHLLRTEANDNLNTENGDDINYEH